MRERETYREGKSEWENTCRVLQCCMAWRGELYSKQCSASTLDGQWMTVPCSAADKSCLLCNIHMYTARTVSFSLCFVCSSLTYYTTIYTKYLYHICISCVALLLLHWGQVRQAADVVVSCPLISLTTAKRLKKCAAKCYFYLPHSWTWDEFCYI